MNIFKRIKRKTNQLSQLNYIDYDKLSEKQTFLQLYDEHPDAVCQLDVTGKVINVSGQAERMFGYNKKELSKHYPFLFKKEYQGTRQQNLGEALQGVARNFEAVLLHKNGKPIHVSITYMPIVNQDLNVIGVYEIAKDMTQNILTKQELSKIRDSLERAQLIAKIGSWDYDIAEDKAYWSEQLYELLGLGDSNRFAPSLSRILQFIHPEDRERFRKTFEGVIDFKKGYELEYKVVRSDGEIIYVYDKAKVMVDEYNQPTRIVGTIQDITIRKVAEQQLAKSEELFRNVYDNLEAGIWSFDIEKKLFQLVSPGVKKISGYNIDAFEDLQSWQAMIHPEDIQAFREKQKQLEESKSLFHEYRINNKDGEVVWVRDQTIPVTNESGELIRLDGIITNITPYKKSEVTINHIAHHDYLTDLPNKRQFDGMMNTLFRSKEEHHHLSLIRIDIDRFKTINDTLSYEVGDQLLKQFAARFKQILSSNMLFSRLGGNEFSILIWKSNDKNEAIELVKVLLEKLKSPFIIKDYELYVTASIGVSGVGDDIKTQDDLLKYSEAALVRAKSIGGNNYQVYSPSLNIESFKLYTMERDLRKAVSNNELAVHYQPRVDAVTGEVICAEALVRWEHPEWGIISPKEFIELAENNGLISDIGDWVLQQVCTYIKRWEHKGLPIVPISINISAQRFLKNDWIPVVENILQQAMVDPTLIEFEITESTLIQYQDSIIKGINKLKQLGIRIALDDFGTGYSSLSYLKEYPIDTIKVDKSFIDHITTNISDQVIFSSIVSLAEGLNKGLVAEGVETIEQLNFLQEHRCKEVQGYLFSKPVPEHEFQVLLQKRKLEPHKVQQVETNNSHTIEEEFVKLQQPFRAKLALSTIQGKKVQLGTTEVLIEAIGSSRLRFLSSINLPVREDFILRVDLRVAGKDLSVEAYINWKEEVQDIYQYEVDYLLNEVDHLLVKRLFKLFIQMIKKNPKLPNTPVIDGNKYKYIKNLSTEQERNL